MEKIESENLLHRAFSVFLFNSKYELLLQVCFNFFLLCISTIYFSLFYCIPGKGFKFPVIIFSLMFEMESHES